MSAHVCRTSGRSDSNVVADFSASDAALSQGATGVTALRDRNLGPQGRKLHEHFVAVLHAPHGVASKLHCDMEVSTIMVRVVLAAAADRHHRLTSCCGTRLTTKDAPALLGF